MKKLFSIMMALAMIVTLSQCRKPDVEAEDNVAKVRISCTIPLNNDGKTDFTNILENSTVNWSKERERIYLAIPETQELVELTSTSEEGGATLTFTGSVQSGILENGAKYDVWYWGRGESKLNNGTLKGSIATQSGKLAELGYHHIAKATVSASVGDGGATTLNFNGNFKNQIAIVRLGEESASTSILRGSAVIGTNYTLQYNENKFELAVTESSDAKISVTPQTKNESYVIVFPNTNNNVELISDSGKKVTFLEGINAGSIYTVGWEDYEEETNTINGYGYVDLGLPSGLLWATCNVGANSPEEYGDYFAWGETTTKDEYTEANCEIDGLYYSELLSQGYIDGHGNLTPEYDAATANWGRYWRMPTEAEMQELIDNCTWTWTTQNGVNGCNVKGPNGNSIFLPAAGFRNGQSLNVAGTNGYNWSSTPAPKTSSSANRLSFSSENPSVHMSYRYSGLSVRPVSNGNIIKPETPKEYVDLGLSVKWATCNVGAKSPEEYGYYYAWGNTTTTYEYNESNCLTYGKNISVLQSGYLDSNGNLKPEYDAATANWGGDWRMPTNAEMQELIDNCTWTWTTQNGVNGYMVTSNVNRNYIFLPAAGYRYESWLSDAGCYGHYWSSTPLLDDYLYNAYYLKFYSEGRCMENNKDRTYGRSVRPVIE